MDNVSGTETDTKTEAPTPYPPPIVGPFSDTFDKTVQIAGFQVTTENEDETPQVGYRFIGPDGSTDGRAFAEAASGPGGHAEPYVMFSTKTRRKQTYTFSPFEMKISRRTEDSHAFRPPAISPCAGCGDKAEGASSTLDLSGLASALISVLGPIFGVKSSGPTAAPYPYEAPPADPGPSGQQS